jgi:hypothetical protein
MKKYDDFKGKFLIDFIFEQELHKFEKDPNGRVTAFFNQGRSNFNVGGVIASLGFEPELSLIPGAQPNYKDGSITIKREGEQDYDVHYIKAVGTAATGRGKISNTRDNVKRISQHILEEIDNLKPMIYAPNFYSTIFPGSFSKEDYKELENFVHEGNPRPITISGYQNLLKTLRMRKQQMANIEKKEYLAKLVVEQEAFRKLDTVDVTINVEDILGEYHALQIPAEQTNATFHDILRHQLPPGNDRGTCSTGDCQKCKFKLTDSESAFPKTLLEEKYSGIGPDERLGCLHEIKEAQSGKVGIKFYPPPANKPLREKNHGECCIGFFAAEQASATVVERCVEFMARTIHRGSSKYTIGDGNGMTVEIDHDFFVRNCDFKLPEKGTYGVGQLYMPNKKWFPNNHQTIRDHLSTYFESKGLHLCGIRDVPVDSAILFDPWDCKEPDIVQVFVTKQRETQISRERSLDDILHQVTLNMEKNIENWFRFESVNN